MSTSCRVTVIPTSTSQRPGLTQKGNVLQVQSQSGLTIEDCGLTIADYYGSRLRLPQKPDYLGPEYFNAGCTSLYARQAQTVPYSHPFVSAPQTHNLMNALFEPECQFTSNGGQPPTCFQGKCQSYNSVLGWNANPQGTLAWSTTM